MFPREKYKYFTNNKDLVIAEQTFAGKKYRGKATVSEPDKFDYDTGKSIAAAKCDEKICRARYEYAKSRFEYVKELFEYAETELSQMREYFLDAEDEWFEALKRLNETMISNGCK